MTETEISKIQSLLNKVNRVTCPYRHNNKVFDKDFINLCNEQISFEEWFDEQKPEGFDEPINTAE